MLSSSRCARCNSNLFPPIQHQRQIRCKELQNLEALRMPQPDAFVFVQPSDGQPTPSNVSNKNMKHGGEVLFLDGTGEVAVTISRNSQQPLSTVPAPGTP